MAKVTVLQILLTPVTMGLSLWYLIFSRLELTWHGLLVATLWLLVGRGIRGYSYLSRYPRDFLLLPLYALVVVFVALPVKTYAILTMNKQGWLTRSSDQVGGDGQTASTLTATLPTKAEVI